MRGSRIGFVLALILCLGLVLWAVISNRAPEVAQVVDTAAESSQAPSADATDATPTAATEPAGVDTPSTARGTLRGRVIDAATGDPVREFEVEFHVLRSRQPGEENPGVRTFRSEDGRFEWPNLLARTWMVTARASDYQRFELMDLQIPQGGATREIVLPLRPGHALRGRVFDEATGLGIPSATISFREPGVGRFEGNFRIRPRILTGKNGSFVLEGLPPGRVTLEIHANGYAGEERAVVVEDASSLEIGLSVGGAIAGRLTAADGITPIAGMAGVFSLDHGYGGSSRTSKTGEFSFPNLAPGRYQISGQAQDGIAELQEIVLGKNQRIEGLVLALGAGRTIRGVVTGLRPEERRIVRISVQGHDSHAIGAFVEAGVDEQGSYAMHGVQPGRVRVVADVPMRRQVSKTVDVPANADVTVDLDFPVGVRLSGRVTRAERPLPNVWMEARPAAAKQVSGSSFTSKSGEYVIEGLAAGEYRVLAGGQRAQLVHLSGDTVLDFDLSEVHLSGRVLEEAGKAPIVGADVDIWPAGPKSPRIRLHDRTDHFGHFALAGLEPGDFVLTAYKPGYGMLRERISFSAPVADMTLRIRTELGVEIRVHDAGTGRSLDDVVVIEMIGQRNGSRLQVQLDENGLGYLPAALAGSTLTISSFGYAPVVVNAWNGQQLDLRFQLPDRIAQ